MSSNFPTEPPELPELPTLSIQALLGMGLDGRLRETAEIAALTGLLATQELAERVALDAKSLTSKALIDIADHSAKLSGLLKRQDEKQGSGAGFSIVINLPGGETATMGASQGTVIDAGSTAPLERLRGATLDFSDAPEF